MNMNSGSYSVEKVVDDVESIFAVGSRFEVCFLFCDDEADIGRIESELAKHSPGPLKRVEASDGAVAELTDSDGERGLVWLSQSIFEPDTWRALLSQFNLHRDRIRSETHELIVIAGPRALHDIALQHCPDLLSISNVRFVAASRAVASARPFRWLHLSDFHFREGAPWDERIALRHLKTKLEALSKDAPAVDAVFVTGDIASSGKRAEYDLAYDYFSVLAEVLDRDRKPEECWFVVPGNHDVDRSAIHAVDNTIISSIKTPEALEQIQLDGETLRLLSRRLAAFYEFTARFLGPTRAWSPAEPWRVDEVAVGTMRLGVLQLNGVWAGGLDSDKGRLFIGRHALQTSLDLCGHHDARVALLHHPLSYLDDFEEEEVRNHLASERGVSLLLRGHLHSNQAQLTPRVGGAFVELACGAAYSRDTYHTGFQMGQLDLTDGNIEVEPYRYSPGGVGFWTRDTLADPSLADGAPWSFQLTRPDAPATPTRTVAFETLLRRYCQAAAAHDGSVRFLGLREGGSAYGRGQVQVAELFVPRRLTLHGSDKEAMEFDALLSKLGDSQNPARLVILSDPGGGKSTLCQYLTQHFASPTAAEPRAPFLLPFREYTAALRDDATLSFIDFLELRARRELSVPLPNGFVKKALERGAACVLFDGLDEVGEAAQRELMRDRVAAFATVFGRVPVVVTSRVAGYQDAALDPRLGFEHRELAPFSDAELNEFIQRWYQIQEPDNTSERLRLSADLLARLYNEPAARALASTPMLATLLALVHYERLEIPEQRVKLYEACVNTLLFSWPARRGKRFEEFDSGLQLEYLSQLAWHYCETKRRTPSMASERDVLLERDKVLEAIEVILESRHHTVDPSLDIPSLSSKWLYYLERECGLLREFTRDKLGFLHLSLLDFLASRTLSDFDLLDVRMLWRFKALLRDDVVMLAVARRAEDISFAERLWAEIASTSGEWPEWRWDATGKREADWSFLLEAMCEGLLLSDEQRLATLNGVVRSALQSTSHVVARDLSTMRKLMSYSTRHSAPVRDWFRAQRESREPDIVRQFAALTRDDTETVEFLSNRTDIGELAPILVEFWPGSSIGEMAVRHLEKSGSIEWAMRRCPTNLVTVQAIATLQEGSQDLDPSTVSVVTNAPALTSALTTRLLSRPGAELSNTYSHVNKMPAAVVCAPAQVQIVTDVRSAAILRPINSATALLCYRQIHLTLRRTNENWSPFADIFVHAVSNPRMIDKISRASLSSGVLSHKEATDFSRDLVALWLQSAHLDEHLGGVDIRDILDIEVLTSELGVSFSIHPAEAPPLHIPAPNTRPPQPPEETTEQTWTRRLCELAAEGFIASMATVDKTPKEHGSYLLFRLQNRWLLQGWRRYIDEAAPAELSPGQLAVYLVLGWTLSTTTHQWPDSARWRALFDGPPPEFWLARLVWHLCWLQHTPGSAEHQHAALAALEEGRADAELPGYAEAIGGLTFAEPAALDRA